MIFSKSSNAFSSFQLISTRLQKAEPNLFFYGGKSTKVINNGDFDIIGDFNHNDDDSFYNSSELLTSLKEVNSATTAEFCRNRQNFGHSEATSKSILSSFLKLC